MRRRTGSSATALFHACSHLPEVFMSRHRAMFTRSVCEVPGVGECSRVGCRYWTQVNDLMYRVAEHQVRLCC